MSRRRPTLTIAPPTPADDTPQPFTFMITTGDLREGVGARFNNSVLTVRAGDPLEHQVRAVEQVIRHLAGRPNELRSRRGLGVAQ